MSVSTETLIAQAKEGADLTNVADYVTNAQWLSWLNDGVRELHRFVTNKFKATYFRTFDFTLTAGQYQVALPANFWRLRGLTLSPDNNNRRRVRPYNFAERDSIRHLSTGGEWWPYGYTADRWYNVVGSSLLQLQPRENVSGDYRVYYTPKPKLLALVRTLVISDGVDHVNPTGGPNGGPLWSFEDFGLAYPSQENIGDILTISAAGEGTNNGARSIVTAVSATSAETDGVAETETFTGITATLTTVLDGELEPYSEYVWLTAAIKSLAKEESYAQARELKEQRNLIRQDLLEAVETDQGGPQTIIDVDDQEPGW